MPEGENFVPEEQGEAAPEAEKGEPTVEDVIKACEGTLSEDAIEDMRDNCADGDEALGFAMTCLLEEGVEDPEDFLAQKGLFELGESEAK